MSRFLSITCCSSHHLVHTVTARAQLDYQHSCLLLTGFTQSEKKTHWKTFYVYQRIALM